VTGGAQKVARRSDAVLAASRTSLIFENTPATDRENATGGGHEPNPPWARRSTGAPQRAANVCDTALVFSQFADMVLDCAVLPDKTLTRRAALTGAVALALAGCTSTPARARPTGVTVSSDPLGPLYSETLALITLYDQTTVANPALGMLTGPLREDHRQHAIALAAQMSIVAPAVSASPGNIGRPTTAPAPSGGGSTGTGSTGTGSTDTASPDPNVAAARMTLSDAETTAQANAVAACLAAPAARSAVLASIAACRATHVDVLR
jgi:hypothetical protein